MVYGLLTTSAHVPEPSFSIDGGGPTVFTPGPEVHVSSGYNILFYASPSLRNGPHNLIVTNLGNASNTLAIDYFIIVSTTNTTLGASTSSPGPGTSSGFSRIETSASTSSVSNVHCHTQ
jgi:hypothetical protein